MIEGNAMIDEDSRIGTLTWDACRICKNYGEGGCKFAAATIFDYGLKLSGGVMYCLLFERRS
jgi:hypothetical protein